MAAAESAVTVSGLETSAAAAAAHSSPAPAPAPEHFVQFYRDEQVLIDALANYVRQALAEGAAAIAIATEAHTTALERRLHADGIDLAEVRQSEQLILLDAEQMLGTFMVEGTPDRERFLARLGSIIAAAAHQRRRVYAFGEMVALLWKADHTAAAVALEQLWNELARQHAFTLFCAYQIQDCGGDHHVGPFAAVCASHARVIPIGALDGSLSQQHQRQIAQLQQKEQMLERKVDQEIATRALLHQQESALERAHLELQARMSELVRFNRAAIGREMRIIELKKEVNALSEQLGQSARYALAFDQDQHGPAEMASEAQNSEQGLVPLESILRTQQLRERPSRVPDHATEIQALTALVQALADAPRTILQTLAEKTLEVLQAGSAGLSLLSKDGRRFCWAAIAGQWSPHLGGGTPRSFGPCGDVLDRNAPLLFAHWERRYPYLADAVPLAEEGLLVPFYVDGRAVGTIWAIAHVATRRFDAEDLRQLESLARFASAAYQATEYLGMLEERRATLNLLEDAMRSKAMAEESSRRSKQSKESLRAKGAHLEGELSSARLLQELSLRLVQEQGIEGLYEQILDGAKTLMHSDCVSMQKWYPEHGRCGSMRLIGSRGFSPEAAKAWEWVDGDAITSCGAALRAGKRQVLADIEQCEFMAGTETLEAYRSEGIRAAQSTPLLSRAGQLLGMLSTHWRAPHEPTGDELRRFDILARQAADLIESKNAEATLRQNEQWLIGQRDAFQSAINGAPLDVSLGLLIRAAIARTDAQLRCAFYIANAERTELHHVSGMTESYAKAVDGFRIAADSLSCGLAVYTGKAVLTADVMTEPLWKDWRWLAQQHEFRACWSFPVESETGKVIGTLAMYYREPREPTSEDLSFAATLTQSAAIIISRHQEAEERLRANRALESAARRKDEFLAMLAHELRNPLAPIRNAGELLARTLPPNSEGQVAVGMIRRQAKQLTQLVDDLLDVARITQGRIELSRSPIDLAAVVAQAMETVEPQVRARRHTVSVTSTQYKPLYVDGDFVRLVQCVANLLTNAAKYTDPGGEIGVHIRAEGDQAVIEVRDSGVGIAAELLPEVFDLFVQSERTLDRAQGGLGIGLSVVKRLVEMHGGRVTARSAGLGQGSSFEMRLPRIAAAQATNSEAAEPKSPPRRVLVVDDNMDAAQSLAMLLNLQGHETRVALSAKDALELIATFRPAVALIDLGLPEMDGYGLVKRLRALPELRSTRLVAVTGYGQAEDRRRSQAAGFDEHLVKPVELAALTRTFAAIPSAGGEPEGGEEPACKPGSVLSSHSSGAPVTERL